MRKIICLVFLLLPLFCDADEPPQAETKSRLHWTSLEVGGLAAVQGTGGCYSGIIRYSPRYQVLDFLSLGASIDYIPLLLNNGDKFSGMTYLGNLRFEFSQSWSIQGSFGAQSWTCNNCGSKTAFGAQVAKSMSFFGLPFIDGIWIQYLTVSRATSVQILLAGISAEF